MVVSCRIATLAAVTALLAPAPASAADRCVDPARAECSDTIAEALASAADGDRLLLAAGDHAAPSEPVAPAVELAGEEARITGTLVLTAPGARVTGVELAGPVRSAGLLSGVTAEASVDLLEGGRVADSTVEGPLTAADGARVERARLAAVEAGGDLVVENAVLRGGLEAGCDATVLARHLTLAGTSGTALRATCGGAAIELRSSVVSGFADVGEGRVTTAYSSHAPDADVVDGGTRVEEVTLGDDLRSAALRDRGDPAPLGLGEGSFDLEGQTRIAGRRDVGAFETPLEVAEPPAGNVLANPGAEEGEAVGDDGEGPPPPGWTRTGAYTSVRYGTAVRLPGAGDLLMPTRAVGATVHGGDAFFSGGGTLLQRIDLTASAAQVDTGQATARLSGLLGGYGADADAVRLRATYRDAEGATLGTLELGPVTAADRANATGLLHRAAGGGVPARTRAVDVALTGTRNGGSYTDAYADNLALVLSVPGVPVPGPVDPQTPPVPNLKPFAGFTVLTPRLHLSKAGTVRVRVACASATVGHCAGFLELRGGPGSGRPGGRIARYAYPSLRPGQRATVTVILIRRHWRALRRKRSFAVRLMAVARDGQGLERRRTVPLRVRPSRR